MKKRILAVVLAALMLVSILPLGIFAEEAEAGTCPGKGETHDLSNCTDYKVMGTENGDCEKVTTTYYCNICNDLFEVVTGGHEWVIIDDEESPEYAHKAPTCTEKGYAYYACTKCDIAPKKVDILPGNIHNNVVEVEGQAATCTAKGWKTYYECKDCGKFYADEECTTEVTGADDSKVAIDMVAHTMLKYDAVPHKYDAAKDEEIPGTYEYYECSVCGGIFLDADGKKQVTDEAELAELDHKFVLVKPQQKYDVHYEIDGIVYHLVQCTVCDKYQVEQCNCCNHVPEFVEAKEPTCTEKGNVAHYHCSKCEKNFGDEACENELENVDIDPTGHSLEHHDAVPHTKTAAGTIEYWECTVCGKKFSDEKGKNEITDVSEWEHKWKFTAHVDVYDTETKTTTTYDVDVCTICGLTENHPHPYDCQAEECECPYTDDEINEIINSQEYKYYLAPTCEAKGTLEWHCDKCQKPAKRELKKLEHAWVDNDDLTDCSVDLQKCENCGEFKVGNHADPTTEQKADLHLDGEGKWCVDQTYVCERCEKTATIKGIGHKAWSGDAEHDSLIEEKTPTCEKAGFYIYTCSRCEDPVKVDVEAKGHKFGKYEFKATCASDAYTVYTCTNVSSGVDCGATYTVYKEGTKLKNESKYGKGKFWAKDDAEAVHGKGVVCNDNRIAYNCAGTTYKCLNCEQEFTLVGPSYVAYPHTWGELIEEKPATCVEEGFKAHYECEVCGAWATEDAEDKDQAGYEDQKATLIIAKDEINGHKWGNLVKEVPATCTEDGKKAYKKCELCGKFLYDVNQITDDENDLIIPTLNHSIAVVTDTRDATCVLYGYEHYECPCGYEWMDNYVKPLGHIEIVDNAHSIAAGCHTAGVKIYICARNSKCGQLRTEKVPYAEENVVFVPETPATCTENGLGGYMMCTVCNTIVVPGRILPATGHTEEIIPGKAATCTEDGLTDGVKCSVCDEILVDQEVIPAKGHTPIVVEGTAIEPTCTAPGFTGTVVCEVCDVTLEHNKVIPATHKEEVIPAVEPTCTEAGLTEGVKCSVCRKILVEQDEVPAKGHTEETLEAVEPTCTEPGLTEGVKCSVCGKILVEQDEVPAKGHTAELVSGKDATCTEDGYTGYTKCSACDKILVPGRIIPAGHTEVIIPGKDATCTEAGLTEGKKCSACDEILKAQEVIPAKGHKPCEWTVVTAPKPGKPGEEAIFCTVCNEKLDSRELTATMKASFNVYNANAPKGFENTYADSSLVAVDVKLGALYDEAVNVWSWAMNVGYDKDVVKFVDVRAQNELLNNTLTAVDGDGYVRVLALAKDAMNFGSTAVDGEELIVTLYFRVNNKDAQSAKFAFNDVQIVDDKNNEIDVTTSEATISIKTLLDPDGNGKVDLRDVYCVASIIKEVEGAAEYDVTVDLNKDGKIDLLDLKMLCSYVAESVGYQEVYDFGN